MLPEAMAPPETSPPLTEPLWAPEEVAPPEELEESPPPEVEVLEQPATNATANMAAINFKNIVRITVPTQFG
jgi:hypothetical protein